jgi:hypothetical protein
MPSVNIGELRDTRRLKARLRAGKKQWNCASASR